ncbi:MAG: transcription termination factor NusA [Anaerolineae bacterium]
MKSEFEIAITQLAADRNLEPGVILEAIEMALVSAYKRNFGSSQNVSVTLDSRTGQAQVFVKKLVVDQVEDESNEMTLDEARLVVATAKVGDYVDVEVKPRNFGRIAAQTAKQVITQRIREAERDSVFAEFAEREGELVNGTIRNVDARSGNVVVSLGKAEAILPRSEQIPREHYRFSQRIRVYIVSVERSARGPQITVSRTHPDLLKRLLELEVPEIYSGSVEVKSIAREPGFRSKVAVAALQPGVDPVGSCVGMRGVRIQNIVNELVGEKIDVVEWAKDERVFIANALSPAKVVEVFLNSGEKSARVVVPDRALSLAIGKEGQNARLAARLTGWRIDILSEAEAAEERERMAQEMAEAEERTREREEARRAAAALLAEAESLLETSDQTESPAEEPELVAEAVAEEALPSADEPEPETLAAGDAALTEIPVYEIAEPEHALTIEAELHVEPVAEAIGPEGLGVAGPEATADTEGVSEQQPAAEAETVAELEGADAEALVAQPEAAAGAEEAVAVPEGFAVEVDLTAVPLVDEEEEGGRARDKSKTRRDRRLEFDEQLGRVVARKQHKRRDRAGWDEDWE